MANVQHIFKSAGAPSGAPTGSAHHHINTSNKDQYLSIGTSGPGDWVKVIDGASQRAFAPNASGSFAGFMSTSDFTKLAGIAAGATANQSDAFLLARANHTGTQSAATITGLATVATSGAYADLTGTPSSLPPNGSAGGDLAGTYPNPTLSTTKETFLLSRANHTGSQTAATISDFSSAVTTILSGTITTTSVTVNGTAGAGFVQLDAQSSAPSTPGTGAKLFTDSSNRFSWKGTNGFVRTFDGTANTADRIYTLPDAPGTVALIQQDLIASTVNAPSATAINTALGGYVLKAGDTMTGTINFPRANVTATDGTGFINFPAQSTVPATPSSGFNFYSGSTGRFIWKGTNGFPIVLDSLAVTALRVYTMPDYNGTLAIDATTTTGDIIYRNSSNQLTRLGIGAEDTILRVMSGLPSWEAENLTQDFGDGSDGNLTVSGALTLTQIPYYNTLTVNAGAAINTNGYPIYCKVLDLSNAPAGAIFRNGNNGTSVTGNAGGAAGAALTAAVLGASGAGSAGAAGATNAGVSSAAVGALGTANGGQGGTSGTSGAGGTGASAAGSAGGAISGNVHFGRFEYQFLRGATIINGGSGGDGGNSGGGDGANSSRGAGGGGGGAGVLVIYAASIITSGSTAAGAIRAIGGNGGTGAAAPAGNVGGSGGAGGGGGGYIYITYVTKTGPVVTGLINASGGNGANGGNGIGTGVGGNGGNGGNGGAVQLFDVTNTVGTLTTGAGGSSGTAGSGTTGGTGGAGGICVVNL